MTESRRLPTQSVRICTEHGYLCFQDGELWICPEDHCGAPSATYVADAALRDPIALEHIESVVDERMRDHQEPDGSYACDPHVVMGYVIAGIEEALA